MSTRPGQLQPPDDEALSTTHEREGRALPPDDGQGVGLRDRLPLTSTTQPGPATLARPLQPTEATQLARAPAPDQPRSQRPWVGQLVGGFGEIRGRAGDPSCSRSVHPLDGVRAKLTRAQRHSLELDREIRAWFERHPYGHTGEFDRETSEYVFRYRIYETPPVVWSVVFGDIVHNLASALDHLAWQLVILNGREPIERQTAFPITRRGRDLGTKGIDVNQGRRVVH